MRVIPPLISGKNAAGYHPPDLIWRPHCQPALHLKICLLYTSFIQTYITTENGNYRCPRCGKIYYALGCRGRNIYISNGTSIRRCQLDPERPDDREEVAVVVENRQRKGIYGVKNTSDDIWVAVFPDQSRREVAKNQGVPVWPGLSITLPGGDVWHIDQKTEKNNE